ncbi:MAG: hypothetical protein BWY70_00928 [Bacteroidetes bacterium ADurb.Bin408]|nr:MAG: hypothetical protein BWY70_00928 [Bacteroidetes bacterium ADurb.Bin408]
MKKILLTFSVLLFSIITFAQTEPDTTVTDFSRGKRDKLKREDFVVSELFCDFWQNLPTQPDVMKSKTLNRGYNAYAMYDNPLGKSNISLAFGVGITINNLYSNAMPFEVLDSTGNVTGKTEFLNIPDNIKYKNNKMTLFYVDVPFEIRIRTKNAGDNFKFNIGVKAGYMLQSHTKYEGDRFDNIAGKIKYKEYNIPNIEKLKYGVTARIGYGKYNVSVYYSLSKLFTAAKGPEMYPISVGIALTPF